MAIMVHRGRMFVESQTRHDATYNKVFPIMLPCNVIKSFTLITLVVNTSVLTAIIRRNGYSF